MLTFSFLQIEIYGLQNAWSGKVLQFGGAPDMKEPGFLKYHVEEGACQPQTLILIFVEQKTAHYLLLWKFNHFN